MTRLYAPILLALGLLLALNAPTAVAIDTPVGEVPVAALDEEEPEAEAAAEDFEVEEEECEEFEEGLEECEEVEAEPRRNGRGSAESCLLRSARGHASVDPRGKLKVTIGYTTFEPAKAKIKLGKIATLQRYLGHSGVLRIAKRLGAKKTPKRLVVRIEIPAAKKAGCPSRRLVLSPR